MTTENDDDSANKECRELKEKLAEANCRLLVLQNEVDISSNQALMAQRDFQNAISLSKLDKARHNAARRDLEKLRQSFNNLQQKTTSNELIITKLKDTNKKLEKNLTMSENNCQILKDVNRKLEINLAISEKNCKTLKEHVGAQKLVLFHQHFQLTNKTNCSSCKSLGSLGDVKEEWTSTPANLEKLSRLQLKKKYQNLQEKYDCLQSVHHEMSMATAGLTKDNKDKEYIQSLEKQLEDLKEREYQYEALFKRNDIQQRMTRELLNAKHKQDKLETDLEEMNAARQHIFDDRNATETKLNKALETVATLQRQKQASLKENSLLQKKFEAANEHASEFANIRQGWIEENRSLQKQLKASKKRARKLQTQKARIMTENTELHQKINVITVQYSSFEKSLRRYFSNAGYSINDD